MIEPNEIYIKLKPGPRFKIAVSCVELAVLVPVVSLIANSYSGRDSSFRYFIALFLLIFLFAFYKWIDLLVENSYVIAALDGIHVNKYSKKFFISWENIRDIEVTHVAKASDPANCESVTLTLNDNSSITINLQYWGVEDSTQKFFEIITREISKKRAGIF